MHRCYKYVRSNHVINDCKRSEACDQCGVMWCDAINVVVHTIPRIVPLHGIKCTKTMGKFNMDLNQFYKECLTCKRILIFKRVNC